MIGSVLIVTPRRQPDTVCGVRLFDQPGRLKLLLAFAAFAAILFSVKLMLIYKFGNNIPFWDQWDAEAAYLYEPYFRGDLHWPELFSAHNEHRIFTTRLLALLLLQINGLWSPLLEMVVNSTLHILALCLTIGLLGKSVGKSIVPLLLAFSVIVFGIPYAYENTLAGFQAQFYFVVLFSVLSIWLIVTRPAFGKGWWGGVAIAFLAYFSFATGVFALAAAAVTLLIRFVVISHKKSREVLAAVLLLALFALGVAATPVIAGHSVLKVTSVGQFVHALTYALAWPLVGGGVSPEWPSLGEVFLSILRNLPWLLLAARMLFKRTLLTHPLWFVFALGVWLAGQAVSVAYGRAADVLSSRYLDLHAFGLLVNFAAVLAGVSAASPSRRTVWRWGAFAWVACMVVTLSYLGTKQPAVLKAKRASSLVQETQVQRYLATHDIATFRAARLFELPYPDANRLASLLDSPLLQSILPGNIQTPLKLSSLEPSVSSGFQSGGAFPGTQACGCASWGSYGPDGDRNVGELRMNYPSRGGHDYMIKVAGYPSRAGRLELVQDGVTQELKLTKDPGEKWAPLYFSVKPSPFTIRAVDLSDTSWLAMSQPSVVGRLDQRLERLLSHWAWFLALGAALGCWALALARTRTDFPAIPPSAGETGTANPKSVEKIVRSWLDWGACKTEKFPSFIKMLVATTLAALAVISWKLELHKGIDFGLLMWAEDGIIFLKGAVEHGSKSLWVPYNGYFHAYPRLIAWISTWTDLHHAPVIFFTGWSLAVLVLAWSCARTFADAKLGSVVAVAAMVLMLTQPNDGEIFYSLTNAQWLLGASLALYLFMPSKRELSDWELFLVALMALTGPFVCVLFPLWLINRWLSTRRTGKRMMVILLVAFIAQVACFMLSDRYTLPHASASLQDWVKPISGFVALAQNPSRIWLAVVFWLVVFAGLIVSKYYGGFREGTSGWAALWLLVAAAGLFAAGMFAARDDPAALGPMGSSSRYYFVPYCLIYVAAILSFDFSRKLQVGIILLIFAVNWVAWLGRSEGFFAKFSRTDVRMIYFLHLAEKMPGVKIPISPAPSWSFELNKK